MMVISVKRSVAITGNTVPKHVSYGSDSHEQFANFTQVRADKFVGIDIVTDLYLGGGH